jgi:hypothetical protein
MGEVVQFPNSSVPESIPENIPENAVGVGGTVAPAPQQEPPMKIVKINLIGVFKPHFVTDDRKSVVQELTLRVPQVLEGYEPEGALHTADAVQRNGGLLIKNSQDSYSFYPKDLFERFAIEYQNVVGVTL